MIRTQSIVSVSDAAKDAAKAVHAAASSRGHLRTKRQTSDESDGKTRTPIRSSTALRSISSPSNHVQRGSTSASGGMEVSTANFEAALKPLQDQQRQLNERMAKMQHTLDVMSYQQKERDSNSNINRDMVMLVVLVVMIQVRGKNMQNFVKMVKYFFFFRQCSIGSYLNAHKKPLLEWAPLLLIPLCCKGPYY